MALTRSFWSCRHTWRRAGANTLRCLVGCSVGDLSALTALTHYAPDLPLAATMGIAMGAGISTSLALETVVLKVKEGFDSWATAGRTAAGMSMISMLSMEAAENGVDLWLTGGAPSFSTPEGLAAVGAAMVAGFVTPLPYNYHRLKAYGKACH